MLLEKLISLDCIKHGVQASSKKRAFEIIVQTVGNCLGCETIMLFETLINREHKGSTAMGNGVAIPHGRISDDEQPIAILLQLEEGIDYDAPDKQPVDLIFALFIPESLCSEFLDDFHQIHECFKDKLFLKHLRRATSEEALLEILVMKDRQMLEAKESADYNPPSDSNLE